MRILNVFSLLAGFALLLSGADTMRPPAVPLIAHDPYFSIWSMADQATDQATKHWTGTDQRIESLIRVDGVPFRVLGGNPRRVAALKQVGLEVTPTRTIYKFEGAGLGLELLFLTPALPDDLDVLSRPLTYLEWTARSLDGKPHQVSVFFEATGQLAVNTPDQSVTASRLHLAGLDALRIGSTAQPVMGKSGDNLRIDWGWLYVTTPPNQGAHTLIASALAGDQWSRSGALPESDDFDLPRAAGQKLPGLAVELPMGEVQGAVSRHLSIAYDDGYSIQYLQRNLRPYWRRNGMGAAELLQVAEKQYLALRERSERFDRELTADLTRVGGENYSRLAVMAFRQTLAAHKLVADLDGTPMYFSKENFSNGCIDTVDVTYPSAPFFLLLNPELLKAQLLPVFEYASLPRWKFPFAPHDLGTYPLANGQVYGGGELTEENQMPVEESGNLLLLAAALSKAEGNLDFPRRYWPLLTRWANYLREKGLDPEEQLSTDDFAGHLAHNTNLSIKAIMALGAYAQMAKGLGHKELAADYEKSVHGMAAKWVTMAADGDHYKLAFDKSGTWSQKYNLVWDKLLDLNLFSKEVARKEIAFYKTKQNIYSLPLDNRATYTKLDWTVWTATLADNNQDFNSIIDPLYKWLNETKTRVPLTDWFDTISGDKVGFQARSVVGGIYIKALTDPEIWRKWSQRAMAAK